MEIFDQHTQQLHANISSRFPIFTISGLDSGRFLRILIFAVNGKGASNPIALESFTLKAAEKQMGTTHSQFEITPVLTVGICIGILTAIFCIALGTILAIKLRTVRMRRQANRGAAADGQAGGKSTRPGNLPIKEKIAMPLGSGDMDDLYDDKNPDVVPCNEGRLCCRTVALSCRGKCMMHELHYMYWMEFLCSFIPVLPCWWWHWPRTGSHWIYWFFYLNFVWTRTTEQWARGAFKMGRKKKTVRRRRTIQGTPGQFGADVEFPLEPFSLVFLLLECFSLFLRYYVCWRYSEQSCTLGAVNILFSP